MKKLFVLAAVTAVSASLLAGCGSTSTSGSASGAYKDGTYKAAYDKLDSHGWKGQIEITIKGGKIDTVNFNQVNKDNKLKSDDDAYEAAMKKANGVGPKEYIPQLNKQLQEKQDLSKVDTVTGATQSSTEFKELSKAALEKAQKGDTSPAVVTFVEKK